MQNENNNITGSDIPGQTPPLTTDTVGQTPTDTQTQPAMAGHVAPEVPGHTTSQPAMSAPTSGPATGYITLDDVAILFEQAGVMRARRTFQRYCETGMLQGQKFDTLNGLQYFVLAASVPRAIESVKALEMSRTRPATSGESAPRPAMSQPAPEPVTPPQPATPAPSTYLDPAMARYVERLEHDLDRAEAENDNKTSIINSLIERDRETNSLTQGLQKLLTPLLGRVYGQDFMTLDTKRDDPDAPRQK